MEDNDSILIGSMGACIAGDHRYCDTLEVRYDHPSSTVTVTVTSSAPNGGMDGPGGSYDAGVQLKASVPDHPLPDIMNTIKRAINDGRFAFKRYGKPSKNFRWHGLPCSGLSQANLKAAIERARSIKG